MSRPICHKMLWRLGWISFFNDLGSEALTRLVPLFVAQVLGAPMAAVGTVEGVAEATATLLKPYFGRLSDRLGRRKCFILAGYALSALSRPFLALAGSWQMVAGLRFMDRVGKGVRTAPRDAWIADISSVEGRGQAFGLNRMLDTSGALLGILVFWGLMRAGHQTQLSPHFWITLCLLSSVPGLIAVALIAWGTTDVQKSSRPSGPVAVTPLSSPYKRYLAIIAVFSLANSSDAFILLRARELGYSVTGILGLVLLLNLISAATALPAAALSDRFGRKTLIVSGWLIYAGVYAGLSIAAMSENPWALGVLVGVYGLFFGFTESVERAWIADLVSPESRARGYGWFGAVVGAMALPASLGFGWIWDAFGSLAAFRVTAGIALLAALLLLCGRIGQGAICVSPECGELPRR